MGGGVFLRSICHTLVPPLGVGLRLVEWVELAVSRMCISTSVSATMPLCSL